MMKDAVDTGLVPAYSDKELYRILERILTENGVPVYSYSLGGPAEECVCLEHRGNGWMVYEISRGQEVHACRFSSFHQACRHLFGSIVIGKEKIMALEKGIEKELFPG